MTNKSCILNVSVGNWYPRGQDRLAQSLDLYAPNISRLFWKNNYPEGCPEHGKVPYAFKPYAFMEAKKQGFDMALWLDSAIFAIRPIDYFFQKIQEDGHVLLRNCGFVGHWCTDAALKPLGLTREESFHMYCIMACVMGLDFRSGRSIRFLDEWFRLANDGVTFCGPWKNEHGEASADNRVLGHRHDQTAASVVSYRLGMKWLEGYQRGLFYYDGRPYDRLPEDTLLLSQGM